MWLLLCLLLTGGLPFGAPIAEFVANCPLSHILPDDPIVFPNQQGASHSHMFYASEVTQYDTVLADLLNGGTTCNVQEDLSSYWHPTVYDGDVDHPIKNYTQIKFYYLSEHDDSTKVIPYPLGLRIVAGDSSSTGPQTMVHYACTNTDESSPTIPTCPESSPGFELFVNFPSCWDGLNLDSPDHKSHMEYPTAGVCPATHPNRLPGLQFKLQFAHPGGDNVFLSSDGPAGTSQGLSLHADFWNAWEEDAIAKRVRNCLWQEEKCSFTGVPESGAAEVDPSIPFEPVVVGEGVVCFNEAECCDPCYSSTTDNSAATSVTNNVFWLW